MLISLVASVVIVLITFSFAQNNTNSLSPQENIEQVADSEPTDQESAEGQTQKPPPNYGKAPLSTQSISSAVKKDGPVVILFFWLPDDALSQSEEDILMELKADLGDAIDIVHISTTLPTDTIAWNDYSFFVRGPPTIIIVTDDGYITDRFMGIASEITLKSAIVKASS